MILLSQRFQDAGRSVLPVQLMGSAEAQRLGQEGGS